jgi:hypothetical protein
MADGFVGTERARPVRREVRRIGGLGPLLALLVPVVAASPALAQFNPVQGREYREILNPVNPVRGEAVLGISVIPADEARHSQKVQVWIPDSFSGELEVETLTADGRFRGSGAFAGASRGGQWVPLSLESTGRSGPSTMIPRPGTPSTLALAVRAPGSALFVARWGDSPPPQPIRFRLYVNSRRADMFVRAGETVVRCTPLDIPQPLRFDTFCDLPASAVPTDGRIVLVRRDQFDEQTQAVTVNVRGLR